MRVVISGEIGVAGQQIIRRLNELGHAPSLVGSNPDWLGQLFPQLTALDYGSPAIADLGYDIWVHLIVPEREGGANLVEGAERAARAAQKTDLAGAGRFICLSSISTLSENHSTEAQQMRLAEAALREIWAGDLEVVYVPAITDRTGGSTLRSNLAKAFSPSVRANELVAALISRQEGTYISTGARVVVDPQDANPVFRFAKRTIDLVLAIGILVCLWWAMIIVWAAVRLQSPGPGIYRQPRVGRDGRTFTCLKFRTMVLSTPDKGTHEISDTAVTRLGRILRSTKLDELPQIFNVIRNEMTFVGPRPSLPSQFDIVTEREKRGILRVKPGITGLSQIKHIDMSDAVRLAECDYRYLALQSLKLDFQIMLATLVGQGSGDRTQK